jgi:hypothetical protein
MPYPKYVLPSSGSHSARVARSTHRRPLVAASSTFTFDMAFDREPPELLQQDISLLPLARRVRWYTFKMLRVAQYQLLLDLYCRVRQMN